MDPHLNLNTEYRAKLTLTNHVICSITGSDRAAVQETVQNLFTTQHGLTPVQRGKPLRFEETENNSTLIFHDSHMEGRQPLGWISEYDIPTEMSVRTISEQRFKAQKVA